MFNTIIRIILTVENTRIKKALDLFKYDKQLKIFYKDYELDKYKITDDIETFKICDYKIIEKPKIKYNIKIV